MKSSSPTTFSSSRLHKSLIHGNSQSSWVSYFKSHRCSENKSYPYYFKLLFQMLPFLLFSIWLPFIRFPVFISLFSDVLALLERLRFSLFDCVEQLNSQFFFPSVNHLAAKMLIVLDRPICQHEIVNYFM